MKRMGRVIKFSVTASCLIFCFSGALAADSARLDDLFTELSGATAETAPYIAAKIRKEWEQSGSAAMDLLLKRGNDAFLAGDAKTAAGHFTALIDHAPNFAEGYSARASAYFHLGLYGPAMADLEQALALAPRHFDAIQGLAVILEETGNPDKALAIWRKLGDLNPHDPQVAEAERRLSRDTDA